MPVETSTIVLAFFALLTTFITVGSAIYGPVLLSRARSREKAEEYELAKKQKEEDYARQDKVAMDLARRQDAVAARVEENARAAAQQANSLEGKIDVVHTLVNSNLTNEKQNRYDDGQKQLATMLEIVDLKKSMDKEPTPEILAEITALKIKLGEQHKELEDRKKQADIADKENELQTLKLQRLVAEDAKRDARAQASLTNPTVRVDASQEAEEALYQAQENDARLKRLEHPAPAPAPAPAPIPVADDRVAASSERMAKAAEKSAEAAVELVEQAKKK